MSTNIITSTTVTHNTSYHNPLSCLTHHHALFRSAASAENPRKKARLLRNSPLYKAPVYEDRVATLVHNGSHVKVPLTRAELNAVRRRAVTHAGLIYVVRGWRTVRGTNGARSQWKYAGRTYRSREEEELTVEWLTDNSMPYDWRYDTILRYPRQWFRVPILAKTKQTARKQSSTETPPAERIALNPSPPSTETILAKTKQTARKQSATETPPAKRIALNPSPPSSTGTPPAERIALNPSPTSTKTPRASCITDCLTKFFDHVGLATYSDKFKSVRNSNPNMQRSSQIIRKMGKFGHRKCGSKIINTQLRTGGLNSRVLYLFQIRAYHRFTGDVDNSHAVCVFNGLIYDANFDRPLDLNKPNMDRCCVGGDSWRFDMVVRCVTFTPTNNVAKFIFKNLRKKNK